MSDLLRTIAFAFRRKGADAMPGTDLRMLLAYDLRWFAPEDAKKVVLRAIETGALLAEAEMVRPSFDVKGVDIPLNFRPTTFILEEDVRFTAAPVAPSIPAAPAAPSIDRASEDERRRRGLLVSLETARLVVRRRAGDDVRAEAAVLEAGRLSAAGPARP